MREWFVPAHEHERHQPAERARTQRAAPAPSMPRATMAFCETCARANAQRARCELRMNEITPSHEGTAKPVYIARGNTQKSVQTKQNEAKRGQRAGAGGRWSDSCRGGLTCSSPSCDSLDSVSMMGSCGFDTDRMARASGTYAAGRAGAMEAGAQ
jgi:hypothetical protein